MMSPRVTARYDRRAIAEAVATCKTTLIETIDRTSLPVSGTRIVGLFAVYGGPTTTTILVTDLRNRIVFWTVSDASMAGSLTCALKALD